MTDSAAVLRREVDTLIQAQITTLNSANLELCIGSRFTSARFSISAPQSNSRTEALGFGIHV